MWLKDADPDLLIIRELKSSALDGVMCFRAYKPECKIAFQATCFSEHTQNLLGHVADYFLFPGATLVDNPHQQGYRVQLLDEPELIDFYPPLNANFCTVKPFEQRQKRIVFAGRIIPFKLRPDVLEIMADNNITVDCYGDTYEDVKKYGCFTEKQKSVLKIHEAVDHLKMPEIFNEYQYFLCASDGPFENSAVEASCCGTIPLHFEENFENPSRIWSKQTGYRFKTPQELVDYLMAPYVKRDAEKSKAESEEMKERCSIDRAAEILKRLASRNETSRLESHYQTWSKTTFYDTLMEYDVGISEKAAKRKFGKDFDKIKTFTPEGEAQL